MAKRSRASSFAAPSAQRTESQACARPNCVLRRSHLLMPAFLLWYLHEAGSQDRSRLSKISLNCSSFPKKSISTTSLVNKKKKKKYPQNLVHKLYLWIYSKNQDDAYMYHLINFVLVIVTKHSWQFPCA